MNYHVQQELVHSEPLLLRPLYNITGLSMLSPTNIIASSYSCPFLENHGCLKEIGQIPNRQKLNACVCMYDGLAQARLGRTSQELHRCY